MAWDKPGALETRLANREAHLDYVKSTGKALYGGPFMDDAGQMAGSMLVLDITTAEEAQTWAANDPYAKAGLFEKVELRPWKKVFG
ncbi:YciI family protein [Pseudooceanicola sp. GBMRC 2024]|uniref:YciI family protein n=2 Tax=Paracoccaceae TaxID=31989 RepID=A0A6L7G916_9RHOB|nr:YciI family protein [Pseudooceanicola albus]